MAKIFLGEATYATVIPDEASLNRDIDSLPIISVFVSLSKESLLHP